MGPKSRRILGSLVLVAGAVTTAYKWVLFLAGGPLVYMTVLYDPRDSGLFVGPFLLVFGIGVCFLRPWKEAEQARSRGESVSRLRVPRRWVWLVLVGVGAAATNAAVMAVLFMLR